MKRIQSSIVAILCTLILVLSLGANNTVTANTAQNGFYIDNQFALSVSDFQHKTLNEKKSIILADNSYLRLGNSLIKTRNVVLMNNSQLQAAFISIAQYEELMGAPIGTGLPGATPQSTVISQAGEYGNKTYNGDVTITVPNVNLKNAVIKGDLIIAETVGQGEAYIDNVKVEGETRILGGGMNSVYFTDSVLATVIVNKNDGTVRVVVEGNSTVREVQLESSAILQERNVTSTGFTNVTMLEAMRNSTNQAELIGSFDTINVRAVNTRINLNQATSIEDLVLSAVATVAGEGAIHRLSVSNTASGSIIADTRPQATLIIGGSNVNIQGQQVTESYSNQATSQIVGISATPAYIDLSFSTPIYNLSASDFEVTAVKNGVPVQLTGVSYDATVQKLLFNPLPVNSSGETVTITVKPSVTNQSLSGSATTTYKNELGFSGRITDIYGVAAPNVTVAVSEGYNRAVTDEDGYYFLATNSEGTFPGTISGTGYLTANIFATVANGAIKTGVNETIMRAASSNEMKIMLTWNGLESDVDSHLASQNFHVYYARKEYFGPEGYQYVDLDWDDTEYYGPETTTIRKFEDGKYVFFIHNYSGRYSLSDTEAKIQVFNGNSTVPNHTFTIPPNTGNNRYWGVFELNVTNNGTNVQLVPLNVLTNNGYYWTSDYNNNYDYY